MDNLKWTIGNVEILQLVEMEDNELFNSFIPEARSEKILERAEKLNQEGRFWHHHMLFPYCMFNKHQGKWTILFEDQDNNEIIENVSDFEPKEDLKFIETLFYRQKK